MQNPARGGVWEMRLFRAYRGARLRVFYFTRSGISNPQQFVKIRMNADRRRSNLDN